MAFCISLVIVFIGIFITLVLARNDVTNGVDMPRRAMVGFVIFLIGVLAFIISAIYELCVMIGVF